MPALHAAKHHALDPGDRPLDDARIDELKPEASARIPLSPRTEPTATASRPEDLRPILSDDVDEMIEALGLHRREHRLVDRGDRARMAAREGDEVLIGLFAAATLARSRATARSSKLMTFPIAGQA
jgi:hypothetical protein